MEKEARARRSGPLRDLVLVLGVAWLVRAAVIATWPAAAHSDDLVSWMQVANELRRGANPYVTTAIVKWPPFALVVVWTIDHVARLLDASFFTIMRATLVLAESATCVALYGLLTRFAPRYRVRRVLLIGISLNPIAILFSTQHENIDVFVGLFVVLGLWALAVRRTEADVVPWLAACLAFGLGGFAKTVPLVLAPLLAPGARAASKLGRSLGLALFLGPIVLSLSIVFVLAPSHVVDNVLRYRSIAGYFGLTGLLSIAHLDRLSSPYGRLFAIALLAGVPALFAVLWRRGLDARSAVLLAGLLLAAVPVLGPGYAPQYAYWSLPALVASYLLFDARWRSILRVVYVVAAATFVVEYALLRVLGSFLLGFFDGSTGLRDLSARLSTPAAQTELRLPLFAALLLLLAAGVRRLRRYEGGESVRS